MYLLRHRLVWFSFYIRHRRTRMRILNEYAMRDELGEITVQAKSYNMVLPHFSKNSVTFEIYIYMKNVQTAILLSQNKIYDSI